MRLRLFHIIPAFFFSCTVALSQNCETPQPPVLNLVSVQPDAGRVDLEWTLSPSGEIAAYIVYEYSATQAGWMGLDTLWDPAATRYSFVTTAIKYMSIRLGVAAYRLPAIPGEDGCPSPVSNSINTIFCQSQIDTCSGKISVRWNRYEDFPKHVTSYEILVSESGGPLEVKYTTGNNEESFTVSGFNTGEEYCFAVRAVLEDGARSSSNRSCLSTRMQKAPGWINADYATVNDDNTVSLSFTVDPISEISRFRLDRTTGSVEFVSIANPSANDGRVTFNDEEADITKINYYRLSAINNCQAAVATSDISTNIVLALKEAGEDLILSWNSPGTRPGAVTSYELYMNTGNGFNPETTTADTVFTISLRDIMYEISGGEVCFFINATGTNNPHGIYGQSKSSSICASHTEAVTVPNLFTPNNDLRNDTFRPVLSFTPSDYHLIISNRHGKVLFETRDFHEEWDGSGDGSGEGVFLWFLRIIAPSGKTISRTGTVTVIK